MILKKKLIIGFGVIITIACFCGVAYISIRLFINQFERSNYEIRTNIWNETAAGIPEDCIVFIGDSHTEYFFLNEYFPELPVINRGIFGDTTYGVLKRLDKSALNLNPSKVFILIGVNDINDTKDQNDVIAENIMRITQEFKKNKPEATIYLQSLYPINTTSKRSDPFSIKNLSNKRISEINMLLESMCRNEGVVYIDLFSKLIDENGQLQENLTIEGLHLNPAGYRFVSDVLLKYLR